MQPLSNRVRRAVIAVTGLTCVALIAGPGTPSGAAARKTGAKATPTTKPPGKAGSATTTTATGAASSQPATTVAQARGKITFGAISELPGLDPAAVTREITGDAVSNAIYDQLIEAPTGKAPTPSLAESLTEAPDRRSWTLKIRDGIRFHDGTTMDAAAVKLNLERQRKSRVNGVTMALIKAIDVIDPLTVKLSLDKPFAPMPYFLAGTVGIIISPKAIQEKADKLNREPTDAGTGPYILKEWVPGDHSIVVRNPDYWGNPKPRLEQITMRMIPDEAARYAALQAGDVQAMISGIQGTVNDARAAGFSVVDPPIQGSGAFYFNNAKPPFDDVRIRRAAAIARDRVALSAVFEDLNLDKQGFGLWPKGNPWYSPDGDNLVYDKDEARRLVASYIQDTGRDAAFTYTIGNGGGVAIDSARLLVKYWQDAGMNVKLQIAPDANQVVLALVTGQYEAVGFVVGLANDPDPTAYPVLYSTSPSNFARYKSAEMDAALETGRTAVDTTARKAAYADVQRIFRRDMPFIVGSPGSAKLIFDKKVCGLDGSGGFTAKTVGLGNC